MKHQLKTIIPLSLALFVLVSYQFIAASSVWSPAPSTPPNPNADMPIHTGGSQIKSGGLSLNTLGVVYGANVGGNLGVGGTASIGGNLGVSGSMWVTNNITLSGKIDGNGGIEAQNVAIGRCPFGGCSSYSYETIQLPTGNNLRLWFGGAQRYVFYNNGHFVGNWIQAQNQMRANSYCDINGNNCTGNDFRVCFQFSDDPSCSGQIGTAQCTPWASEGGAWTPWRSDSNGYDPDCMRMKIETR